MERNNIIPLLSFAAMLIFNLSISGQLDPRSNDLWLNNSFSKAFYFQKTPLDSLVAWQEHIVLQTDKTLLTPKDHLFFKAYILTGPDRIRVSVSDVLKVELLDESGTLINSQYHKIVEGTCEGSFEIPKKTKVGNYYFRAYTRWMLNYGPSQLETKKIRITGGNDFTESVVKPDELLNAFPEGGLLVDGLTHKVAISFKNNLPDRIPVVNSKGEEVASVKNFGKGLGSFLFTPVKGERYSIRLSDNQTIPLPDISGNGYSMRVNNLSQDHLNIRIEVSPELRREPVFLKGKSKGVIYFNSKIDFKQNGLAVINIPKSDLPRGLLTLSLEDEFNQIWAKRPIYCDTEELQIQLERQTDTSGNNVMHVRVTDLEGKPVKTDLSLALVGKEFSENKFDPAGQHMFIDKGIRSRRFINDMLVLTRQLPAHFSGSSINEIPDKIRYTFQNGLEFYGQAYDLNNTLLVNSTIQILISTNEAVIARETETNADGLFKLDRLQLNGEAKLVFRTRGEDAKSKLVKVIPYEYEIPPIDTGGTQEDTENMKPNQILPNIAAIDFLSSSEKNGLIRLDAVTLTVKRPYRKTTPSAYDLEPSRVVYQDSKRPKPIPQLFLGIPGVQVIGLGNLKPSIVLPRSTGAGPLVWVVDGFPMIPSTNLADIMDLISYADIKRIELLLGPKAAMYGSRAAGGVVQIYTRSGSEAEYVGRKDAHMSFQGFHESIKFESYRKSILAKRKSKADIPTTFYWNPYLSTDENGEAVITISLPEDYDRIKIQAFAIMENGGSGSLNTTF